MRSVHYFVYIQVYNVYCTMYTVYIIHYILYDFDTFNVDITVVINIIAC